MKTIVVLALCIFVVCEAIPVDVKAESSANDVAEKGKKMPTKLSDPPAKYSVDNVHLYSRKQNSKCLVDIAESSKERYKICTTLFESIFEENVSFTDDKVTSFCVEHSCPQYMLDLGKRMIQDCNFHDTLNLATVQFMKQACARGPRNERCISLWHSSYLLVIQNSTESATVYNKCLQEFHSNNVNGNIICPKSCKFAEHWVQQLVGCCYRSLMDYTKSIGANSLIILEDYWNLCSFKEPDVCPEPDADQGANSN